MPCISDKTGGAGRDDKGVKRDEGWSEEDTRGGFRGACGAGVLGVFEQQNRLRATVQRAADEQLGGSGNDRRHGGPGQ